MAGEAEIEPAGVGGEVVGGRDTSEIYMSLTQSEEKKGGTGERK